MVMLGLSSVMLVAMVSRFHETDLQSAIYERDAGVSLVGVESVKRRRIIALLF